MKHIMHKKSCLFSFGSIISIAFIMFFVANVAHAVTPILSIIPNNDGDTVQLNVTGDSNASVVFYYFKTGAGQQIKTIGTTNSNGNLVATVSNSDLNVASNSSVYITVGGLSGPKSSTTSWPLVTSYISSNNMISLSQTGLVLTIGQSSTITVTNINSGNLYLSSNSSPMIANVNITSNQVTVLANSYGSTVATICLTSNSSNCGSIYVTVQNGNAQPLSFSQSSISLYSGQNVSIQISGGSGSYLVLNNATQNQALIQTNISGSVISLTTSSTTGSSSITVCSKDMTSCGIINVTINSNNNSTPVSFSQSSPTVIVGQSLNVSIYGPSNGLFYVSSNSNPGIVQANVSGNILTLLGITNGSSTMNICASANSCGSLTVTVNYNSGSSSIYPILSQDNVTLSVGQNLNITISGGLMPYNIISTANSIFRPTLNTNTLSLYGINTGSGIMNVCSSAGNCANLSVTVTAQNTVSSLPAGCSSASGYSQTTGLPCVYSYSTTGSVVIPNDCTGTAYSISTGIACPAGTIKTENTVATSTSTTNTTTTTTTKSTVFKFTKTLKLGDKGSDVTQLQKKLKTLGYYNGKISGSFDSVTEKAVKALQKAHKLSQVGSVGPLTRALLNK